eukprot:snap_masked-scaffold_4-processed-gene-20.30-mRNA-1 protein AED:1.00 eAED:1.00 QI:0/0/0/0/1/1/2/0/59
MELLILDLAIWFNLVVIGNTAEGKLRDTYHIFSNIINGIIDTPQTIFLFLPMEPVLVFL